MSEASGRTIPHPSASVGGPLDAANRPLLDPREPAAFTLLNENGSAPLLLACDHASNRLPASMDQLGIETELLEKHVGYDIGSEAIGRILMERFDAPLLVANYSRLAIDLNRHHDDPSLIPEVSDGHVICGNQDLSADVRQHRIDQLFTPYHDAYHQVAAELKSRFNRPLIFAVHSFTPQIQGIERPWHFGVLWDRDRTLAGQLLANFRAAGSRQSPPLVIGDNQPYHACAPLGYAMVKHAQQLEVEMALIETRQDLVADEAGQRWAADLLYQVLAPLLDKAAAGQNR